MRRFVPIVLAAVVAVAAAAVVVYLTNRDPPLPPLNSPVKDRQEATEAKAPTKAEELFQAGQLKLETDDVPGAVKLFLQSLEHGGEKRWMYRDRFVWAMAEAGKTTEAYAALSDADSESGFRELVKALRYHEKPNEPVYGGKVLEALIAAHRKRKPQDAWLAYYQAMVHREKREYDAAERELADGMARLPHGLPPSPEAITIDLFRGQRVTNLVDAGRIFEAYWKVGPRRATFDQLGYRFYDKSHLPMLAILVWVHGWVDPADPQLLHWRGHLAFETEDYKAAGQYFITYLAAARTDESLFPFAVTEELVRSLLRVGRLAEARATLVEADSMTIRVLGASKWLLDVAITAAGGDVDQTERELDEMVRKGQVSGSQFYRDADLGPLLRTPPFKRVRDKYPPPPDEPERKE